MAPNGDGAVRRDQTSDLQLLVDSAPSLIDTGRPDGYLDFFNQTWLRYVGRALEDLQGWKWTAFIHPEDVEGIMNTWRAPLPSGEPFLHETRVRRADGEYRWMLHHKVPLGDERGDEQLLVSVNDTGVGLPPQQVDQTFNAFFTIKRHGIGMGLSISRSIVEAHGGRLRAASNPLRGASFSFTSPTKLEADE